MFLHFTDSQTTGYVNFRPHAAEVLVEVAGREGNGMGRTVPTSHVSAAAAEDAGRRAERRTHPRRPQTEQTAGAKKT